MKILIAPNSFKECADSVKIAGLFYGYLSGKQHLDITLKPLSDGGDGFLNVCVKNFDLDILTYKIPAPYGSKPINCRVGYGRQGGKIYIESADAVGLKLIPKEKRHPLYLNSRGLGVLLFKIANDIRAKKINARKVVIGIGGTGTNDMAIGALYELGLKLLDKNDNLLEPIPANYSEVRKIIRSKIKFPFKVELVTDVINPLTGKNGSSNVYGRQKGLTSGEIKIAEAGFRNIIRISRKAGITKDKIFISGAGGGLAGGLQMFLNAGVMLSDKFISRELGLAKREKYAAVITAEGAFDEQSFMNKAAGTVIKKYSGTGTKVFLVCGKIDEKILGKIPADVIQVELLKYFSSTEESIKYYKRGIKFACRHILKSLEYYYP